MSHRKLLCAPALLMGLTMLWSACGAGREPSGGFGPGTGSGGEAPITVAVAQGSGGGPVDETVIPDPDAPCDANIAIDSDDPLDGAAAIGLCKTGSADEWGIIDARWAMPDGADAVDTSNYHVGHGVLDDFGAELDPIEGSAVLALSSGTAREPTDQDWADPVGFDKALSAMSPFGFPKESPACAGVVTGEPFDAVALEVTVKAPDEANGLGFDFDFFTYEWPDFVCSTFNDFFVVVLEPFPSGQSDGNISFDSVGNPVSVNNALVQSCTCASGPPCDAPPFAPIISYDCDDGASRLQGTGFETGAATGWLTTKTPVAGGEVVKLRFTVYDSGDGVLDSTTIVDNFRWLGEPPEDVETTPIPK
jgi:hypothetical protein